MFSLALCKGRLLTCYCICSHTQTYHTQNICMSACKQPWSLQHAQRQFITEDVSLWEEILQLVFVSKSCEISLVCLTLIELYLSLKGWVSIFEGVLAFRDGI